ncbi:MAG: sulfite exporter TauE/SafE family protein, partial [Ignavibacteriaceae bacterium]
GSSVGVLSTFTGLGGGIIFFPVLHYLYSLDTKKAVGTSSVITAITMIFGSISFYLISSNWTGGFNLNYIYLAVALPLGLGAVAGAKIGVNFVQKSSTSTSLVKKIFAILLIIVVVKIIFNLW